MRYQLVHLQIVPSSLIPFVRSSQKHKFHFFRENYIATVYRFGENLPATISYYHKWFMVADKLSECGTVDNPLPCLIIIITPQSFVVACNFPHLRGQLHELLPSVSLSNPSFLSPFHQNFPHRLFSNVILPFIVLS